MNGFSSDGYIICQDSFFEYEYRTIESSLNGCGWMAAYNLRHFLEGFSDFDAVRIEMDKMHSLRTRGPTTMRVMRKYIGRYCPGFREYTGRRASLIAAKRSRCGVLRYYEEGIPHFVAFIRQNKGSFRFFNVNDGLEDFTSSIDDFAGRHILREPVTALIRE